MAKDYCVADIRKLLEQVAARTSESLDHYGLGRISEKLNGTLSQKYLYDNLLRPVEKLDDNETLRLTPNKVDELARFLGYGDLNDFLQDINSTLHPVLKSLAGSYYSYVRKNSKEGFLLQSPVRIEMKIQEIHVALKGPRYEYNGRMIYSNGCVTFSLVSEESKKFFYHTYKIGNGLSPVVLQGIFSGVSSSNDPIGGRCLLVRQDKEFEDLVNSRISISDVMKSNIKNCSKVGRYFLNYNSNNLRINNPYGFDWDDLEEIN